MIEIAYPAYASGEPRPLKAELIRTLAADVRGRLFPGSIKRIEVAQLARRACKMKVNGRAVRVIWDLAHPVHDNKGTPVLGICEHDPIEPRTVMISLNAHLADEPELLRSTAAHELGHAIFDMPAAMGAGSRQTFRNPLISKRTFKPVDWREWRADEFMGAFLVPPYQLSKAFARCASATNLTLRWKGTSKSATPGVSAREIDDTAVDGITDMLAEEFGVSPAFMAVRLRKGEHLVATG
jgi:hypothetical protein